MRRSSGIGCCGLRKNELEPYVCVLPCPRHWQCDSEDGGLLPAGNFYYLLSITCHVMSSTSRSPRPQTHSGERGKPLNKLQSQSKGVSTSNPKSGQLSAKLAAERKKAVSPGGGTAANDDRMMVSSLMLSIATAA